MEFSIGKQSAKNQKKSTILPSKNDVCGVVIHSQQLIPMDDFKENQRTGRFCLLDDEQIIAGGIIPDEEIPKWKEIGIEAIFGPGSSTNDIINYVKGS